MASFCRSAARSFVSRSKSVIPKTSSSKPVPSPFSSSTRSSSSSSRFVKVIGCVESMMPLHSAIAYLLVSNLALLPIPLAGAGFLKGFHILCDHVFLDLEGTVSL